MIAVVEHEQPERDPDLRPGQADAGGVVHRLEHVLGQPPKRVVEVLDGLRGRLQHRVAQGADRDDHVGCSTVRTPRGAVPPRPAPRRRVQPARGASDRARPRDPGRARASIPSGLRPTMPSIVVGLDDSELGLERSVARHAEHGGSDREPRRFPTLGLVHMEPIRVAAHQRLDRRVVRPIRLHDGLPRRPGPTDRLHPRRKRSLAGGDPWAPLRTVGVEDGHQLEIARAEVAHRFGPCPPGSPWVSAVVPGPATRSGGPVPAPPTRPTPPRVRLRRAGARSPSHRNARTSPAPRTRRTARRPPPIAGRPHTPRTLPAGRTSGRPARSRTRARARRGIRGGFPGAREGAEGPAPPVRLARPRRVATDASTGLTSGWPSAFVSDDGHSAESTQTAPPSRARCTATSLTW